MAELARQADSFLGVSFVLTVVRLPACLLKNQMDVCSPTWLPRDSVFTGAQTLCVAFFELAPKDSAVDQSAHPVPRGDYNPAQLSLILFELNLRWACFLFSTNCVTNPMGPFKDKGVSSSDNWSCSVIFGRNIFNCEAGFLRFFSVVLLVQLTS